MSQIQKNYNQSLQYIISRQKDISQIKPWDLIGNHYYVESCHRSQIGRLFITANDDIRIGGDKIF